MGICLGFLCLGLLLISAALGIKIAGMRHAADEIKEQFQACCREDTNRLIAISSRDSRMRTLAAEMNRQLAQFHRQRHRYQQGDLELKEAVTNISHDLRTPLTGIFGYARLMEEEELTEDGRRYLALIQNRAKAMKKLSEELFQYSVVLSVEEQEEENINVGEALEESLAAAYVLFQERGITPKIQIPGEKVERLADREALLRIFGNIISNGVKYSDGGFSVVMEPGGRITFSNPAARLNALSTARLFDRFYTVETGRGGTGLGLSIAKTLTERMGGRIWAEYEDGWLSVSVEFSPSACGPSVGRR